MKKPDTIISFGAVCAILVGVLYILTAVTWLILPAAQQPGSTVSDFLLSVARDPHRLLLHYFAFIASSVVAIGAVPAISATVREGNEGLVQWVTVLAYLAFSLTIVTYVRYGYNQPLFAASFASASDLPRQWLGDVTRSLAIDAGWVRDGGTGLWLLVISVLGLQDRKIPPVLAYLGLVVAGLYWLIVVGFMFQFGGVFGFVATVGGMVLAPIWYISMGLMLRKRGTQARRVAEAHAVV
jgi:hypothetical protein